MKMTKEGKWSLISLPGKMTLKEAQEFSSLIEENLNPQNAFFIVDASALKTIDSYTIGYLIKLLHKVKKVGGDICIKDLEGETLEIFKHAGLDRVFMIKKGNVTYASSQNLFSETKSPELEILLESGTNIAIFHLKGTANQPIDSLNFASQSFVALSEKKKIILDIEHLSFFDNTFTDQILKLDMLLKSSGGELRICSGARFAEKSPSQKNLNKLIPIYPSQEKALDGWA